MSEKRFANVFVLVDDNTEIMLKDTENDVFYDAVSPLVERLLNYFDVEMKKLKEENKQLRKYNKQLKERLEKINGGYGHLTHRNGLTANEWLIESQEKELKKKNEQISDWIERHSKDIAKISEQNKLIQTLKEENEQLRQFINKGKRLSVKELMGNINENLVLKKKIRGLEKENEQLKEEIGHYTNVRNKKKLLSDDFERNVF